MEEGLRSVLEQEPRVRFALLFGSFATGRAHRESDVDVAVSLSEDLQPLELGAIARRLEVAAGRPVQVVLVDEVGIPVAYRAFRDGVLLLCRDRQAFVERKARAVLDYLDFRPVEEQYVQGILERARGR